MVAAVLRNMFCSSSASSPFSTYEATEAPACLLDSPRLDAAPVDEASPTA